MMSLTILYMSKYDKMLRQSLGDEYMGVHFATLFIYV